MEYESMTVQYKPDKRYKFNYQLFSELCTVYGNKTKKKLEAYDGRPIMIYNRYIGYLLLDDGTTMVMVENDWLNEI